LKSRDQDSSWLAAVTSADDRNTTTSTSSLTEGFSNALKILLSITHKCRSTLLAAIASSMDSADASMNSAFSCEKSFTLAEEGFATHWSTKREKAVFSSISFLCAVCARTHYCSKAIKLASTPSQQTGNCPIVYSCTCGAKNKNRNFETDLVFLCLRKSKQPFDNLEPEYRQS
jgi:hypothetical protein